MLGKLMKYEFKATGRIFLPMFGALLVVAAVNRLFLALNLTAPKVIGTTISVAMIAAVCVIALVLTLQRFYRNLLKSEGYLMFTLPVSTDALIWSKLFAAVIWTLLSLIVVTISIMIMAMTGEHFRQMFEAMAMFFRQLQGTSVLCVIEAVIIGITAVFSGILLLYVCMALSLFVNKHRVGFAFLMYIAISTLGQIVFAIAASAFNVTKLWRMFENLTTMGQMQTAFILTFLCAAIPGVIFYVVTRLMLKNKLNLE